MAKLALSTMLGVLLIAAWLLLVPRSRITRENFERLRIGMNLKEVEDLLGPPGDFSTGPLLEGVGPKVPHGSDLEGLAQALLVYKKVRALGLENGKEWSVDTAVILLLFDANGLVRGKQFVPACRKPESLWATIRTRCKAIAGQ